MEFVFWRRILVLCLLSELLRLAVSLLGGEARQVDLPVKQALMPPSSMIICLFSSSGNIAETDEVFLLFLTRLLQSKC